MSIAVVTTFSPLGYEVYGRRMIESFAKFWPADVKLYAYYEGRKKPDDASERAIWKSLSQDLDRKKFMTKYNDHPIDYRRKPVKFCHKVFAVTAAPRDTDWLIWLDGDVETTAPVTHEFLCGDRGKGNMYSTDGLLPDHVIAVYLGRRWWQHSECGFVAYNLDALGLGQEFLDDMRKIYTSGDITRMSQQHDCMAFDTLRLSRMGRGYQFLDLGASHKGPGLDVMPHTPLGAVMTHYKGPKAKRAAYGAVA